MDSTYWNRRRVLVTGHTGFKGAWLSLWLGEMGAQVAGVALAPESPTEAFSAMAPWDGIDDERLDIRDGEAVADAFGRHQPEVVFHLAAQALVRRGYRDPVATYETNVMGTVHVLRAVELTPSVRSVVVVTSDKVYANAGGGAAFREGDPLGHVDPYSNSKACAELVTSAWRASFLDALGIGVATARAGNVIGGGDEAEDRLLPDARRAVLAGAPMVLRNPQAVRPWQHVVEPVAGYLALAQALAESPSTTPAAVNFGPDESSCRPVGDVVERVLHAWGPNAGTAQAEGEQPHEAALLRLDSTLAREALGWQPRLGLDDALAWTAEWWRAQADGADMRAFSTKQLQEYGARMGARS